MILAPDRVSLRAPAKINLYLKVTGRREDGYHYLATLMQKISLFDRIELERIPEGIRLHCPGSSLPADESNLAFRAARLFLGRLQRKNGTKGPGVAIELRKSIPVAAGLGGGSSDAGAVLRGLNSMFSHAYTDQELLDMGASLGADVPFFVSRFPIAWATGIGERLQPAVQLSGYRILIVNPGYSVSTRWVYENFALTVGQNIYNLQNFANPESIQERTHPFLSREIGPDELVNDLEKVTAGQYPEIDQLKERLLKDGAAAALMSGSGPTVFGLFRTGEAEKAAASAEGLKREFRNTFLADPLQT